MKSSFLKNNVFPAHFLNNCSGSWSAAHSRQLASGCTATQLLKTTLQRPKKSASLSTVFKENFSTSSQRGVNPRFQKPQTLLENLIMPIATPDAGKDRLKAFKNKGKDQDVSIVKFHISIRRNLDNEQRNSSNDNDFPRFLSFVLTLSI